MIHQNINGKAKCGAQPYHRISWNLVLTDDAANVNCKRCLGTVKRTVAYAKIEGNMIGKIFHTSWGYDMTINEYVKVIKQTEKSLLVQECICSVTDDYGKGNGKATTDGTLVKDAKPFYIKRKDTSYGSYWKGSMNGNTSASLWNEWDGKANYHNTWD